MFPIRDTQRSYATPVVTVLLIVTNILIFLYQVSLDPYTQNHLVAVYGLTPAPCRYPSQAGCFHAFDMITSMFLHGGWMHVLGNMWFLWVFGDNIEDILGHGKFFIFYIACGVAAAATHMFFNPGSRLPTVGASGAIAGVMGAYLLKFPRNRILTLIFFGFVFFLEIPAVVMLGYWFLLQLFSGVGSVGTTYASQGGVAWFAHVGGFLAGMVLVNLMSPGRAYSRRRDVSW
jgi:membrane associated rhomboid family serine protease